MVNTSSFADLQANKPTPLVLDNRNKYFKRDSNLKQAIHNLNNGEHVLIMEFYSNGLTLLKGLQEHLSKEFPDKTFQGQRDYRAAYQKMANLIVVEIVDHKIDLKKAPSIGWLEKLYPEEPNICLTFPQIQGLNSAWQWYTNGIQIPVLRNKIHPFYDTYFPTRFDQLILFDNWLKRYEGAKKTAIDVGFGSGVLALQLIKHGFQKVFGTDTNPNAVIGMKEFMGETKLSRKFEVDYGNLFGKWEKPSELIVFNPPWMPKASNLGKMDEAIYYEENLFPDFFKDAKERLLPDGKLVILFSNLAEITNVTEEHPIKKELADGGRFKLEKCLTKSVKIASDKTKRNQSWRKDEVVELWILTN